MKISEDAPKRNAKESRIHTYGKNKVLIKNIETKIHIPIEFRI